MTTTMEKSTSSLIQKGNPNQTCIDACVLCAQICQECLNMCLQEDDVKARVNCIKTLQDCSEICVLTAGYMSRSSGSIKDVCNVCAAICEKCATECDEFQDQHCQTCAGTCNQCATECKSMGNM
jgi:hypothetical protein